MHHAFPHDYYVRNRQKILKEFDTFARVARRVARFRFDDRTIDAIAVRARVELERLLPRLPYVGGDQSLFTPLMINSAETLAFYRACTPLRGNPREMGQLLYEIAEAYTESLPGFAKWLARRLILSASVKRRWRAALIESQRRAHPGNWVGEFVEGDGESFDYGFNFTECGWLKLVEREGGAEIAPYICLSDYAKMRGVGIGFLRTQTLAAGAKLCDFRFIKGYKTARGWPPEALGEWRSC